MNDPEITPAQRLSYAIAAKSSKASSSRAAKRSREDDKKSKKSKKKRKKRDSSDSSRSSESDSRALFRMAAPLARGSDSRIKQLHEDQPGALYSNTVNAVSKLLGGRGVASSGRSAQQWGTYLRCVLYATQHAGPPAISTRHLRSCTVQPQPMYVSLLLTVQR